MTVWSEIHIGHVRYGVTNGGVMTFQGGMMSVSGESQKVRGHSHTAHSPSSPSHIDAGDVYVGRSSSSGYPTVGG